MKTCPIQTHRNRPSLPSAIPETVHMRAYEVYSHVHSPQVALTPEGGRNCRGGFGVTELVAYLYAFPFPKDEWRQKVDEVFEGSENL